MITNPRKKGSQSKSNVKVNTEIIENDDTIIQSIIDTVSDVIVKKLLSKLQFR